MRKLSAILLALSLLTGLIIGCGNNEKKPAAEIVILHTNDMHGRVVGNDQDIIGIDRVAAIHKNTPNSILLDTGDTFHGLPIAGLSRGENIAALMREAGYDAMTPGNHDFNYGWERLTELREIAGFPVMSSNVTRSDFQIFNYMQIIEADGVKIGLFGITTEYTEESAMPEYVSGLSFKLPVETARYMAEYLREQDVHIIVALCHMGSEGGRGVTTTEVAEAVPEIDVIIDGHTHEELPEGLIVNGVLIAQAGQYLNNLGEVTVTVEDGRVTSKTASLITYEEAMKTEPDETVAAMLAEMTGAMESLLGEPVGESNVHMSSQRAPGVRTQEMPLGSFVADAYREAAGADIAFTNGGDIRADIPIGAITKGDVVSILPFGNTMMVKTITPAILKQALENGVTEIILGNDGEIDHEQSQSGRYLQVSGFRFTYDPAAPAGERVLSITLDDGRALALDDNMTALTLAGSNYILTGGDGYAMFADLSVLREFGAADEALAEYIEKHSPISAPELGRITTAASAGIFGDGHKIPHTGSIDFESAAGVERMFDLHNSKYFPELDFYNMKSGNGLTIIDNFRTIQQTTEVTCGPSVVIMLLEYYGLYDGKSDQELYELRENKARPESMLRDLMTMLDSYGEWDFYSTYDLENPDEDLPPDFIINTLNEGKPIVFGDGEWGIGHWRIIIGYDDMGDDLDGNDILILAEPYDTNDHNQDGYMIMPFWRLYYNWANQFDPDFSRNLFLVATPK